MIWFLFVVSPVWGDWATMAACHESSTSHRPGCIASAGARITWVRVKGRRTDHHPPGSSMLDPGAYIGATPSLLHEFLSCLYSSPFPALPFSCALAAPSPSRCCPRSAPLLLWRACSPSSPRPWLASARDLIRTLPSTGVRFSRSCFKRYSRPLTSGFQVKTPLARVAVLISSRTSHTTAQVGLLRCP